MKENTVTIKVTDEKGASVKYVVPSETRIDEYANLFKAILTYLTFPSDLVDEVFKDDLNFQ